MNQHPHLWKLIVSNCGMNVFAADIQDADELSCSSRPTGRHMSCFLHRVLLGASGDLQHLRVTTESEMSSNSARPQQISKPDRAVETPDCPYPGRSYYGCSTYRRRVSRAWYMCYPMHTPDPAMNIVPWKRKPLNPANSRRTRAFWVPRF